jgi:hypothetical protein
MSIKSFLIAKVLALSDYLAFNSEEKNTTVKKKFNSKSAGIVKFSIVKKKNATIKGYLMVRVVGIVKHTIL